MPTTSLSKTTTTLISIVALLLPVVTLVGLLLPGFYRDTAWMIPQARGQDLITLIVAEPLLIGALIGARRGRVGATLVLMGTLGYVLYTYAMYSYTAYFNRLFLAYVALMSASLFALVDLVLYHSRRGMFVAMRATMPARTIASFCALVGSFFLVTWLGQIVPATLQGTVPQSVLLAKTPTSAVHVQDLAVVIPLFFVAAVWLWQRRPQGAALAAILLVIADIMLLTILAMGVFMAQAGINGALDLFWLFAMLEATSVGFTALTLAYLRRPASPHRDVPPAERAVSTPGATILSGRER